MATKEQVLRYDVLSDRLRRVTERIREAEEKITEYQDLREDLRVERKVLTDLLDNVTTVEVASASLGEQLMPDLPGPTEAILDLVSRRPGLLPKDIVDAIEDKVDSDAKDIRKTLYTVISRLKRDGAVLDQDGKVYPTKLEIRDQRRDLRLAMTEATRITKV